MNSFEEKIKSSFSELISLKSDYQKIYLVGGFMRDLLLSTLNRDVDIVCNRDSVFLAKKWAEKMRGAFFVMDEERKTCRVLVPQGNNKLVFDFALLRGDSIDEDLTLRDFTVNAIAVDLEEPGVLIDPCDGQADLQQRLLRPCSPKSIQDDPVRILRAARYSAAYALNVAPETEEQINQQIHLLDQVSGERKRDELFKILGLSQPVGALMLLKKWHVFEVLKADSEALTSLPLVERVSTLITEKFSLLAADEKGNLFDDLQQNIQKYYEQLTEKNTSDRTTQQLLLLACLLWNQSTATTEQNLKELLLSREELERLRKVIFKRDLLANVDFSSPESQRRTVYVYFREMGSAGLDLAAIHLGEVWPATEKEGQLQKAIILFRELLHCWYEHPEITHPSPLLSGNELMFHFDLTPGPFIGELLDLMKEEQAVGFIKTKEDALRWSEEQVMRYRNRKRWAN